MKEVFVKKYWDEENTLFYLHFIGQEAVRQIEVTSNGTIKLTDKNPIIGDAMLYDQRLDELELTEEDFITKEEFNEIWNK